MKNIKINNVQKIVNKSNNKVDFTYNLNNNNNRYIVSVKNIYLGFNPSLCTDLNLRVKKIIDSNLYDSIGGWNGQGTNKSKPYYLDANVHFKSLDSAINVAKKNNQMAIFDAKNNLVITL